MQPKTRFFALETLWGKVLTLDRIQKRGWVLPNRCCFCQTHAEFIDHLLLHCEKTRELWVLALFIVWSVLSVSFFGKGNPLRVEEVFCG